MSRHQLANAREHRLLAADESEAQIFSKHGLVKSRRYRRMRQQRLDFRSKREQPAVPKVVKRFNAEAVASAKQGLTRRVPNRECEHPPEQIYARGSMLFV